MILYIENPKDATRKLLELINEFGKVAGYKINIYKLVAFPGFSFFFFKFILAALGLHCLHGLSLVVASGD